MASNDDPTNYSDYNGGSLLATAISLLIITTLTVLVRLFVRIRITQSVDWDDYLLLVSQANFTISCAFIIAGVSVGLGHHNESLSELSRINAGKWQALATVSYISNMMFIKLCIGFFLIRLAVERRYIYILWASMAVVFVWSLVLFFWDLFLCAPLAAQWDFTIIQQTCQSAQAQVNAAYALSVMSIVSDWLYALLPIPMVWKVQMNVQKRISVVVVLALGIFASVATVIRLAFLANLVNVNDILYVGTEPMIWTIVEPGVAIIAASVVAIRPLLRAIRFPGFSPSLPSDIAPGNNSTPFRTIGNGDRYRSYRSRVTTSMGNSERFDTELNGKYNAHSGGEFGSADDILRVQNGQLSSQNDEAMFR